ncbi:AtpZ/AtpI family protein [Notoacmeibacter sp. MSK16QG-6]|uniref:AtpZ/AtpI family protein n=1 Tax=Notoacmeibacter sp. MSK16QG-6 TaxID=2957982 RepID=UPI00209D4D1C|nr:AtpZ/AtpI family protein [Notoacmeibacter sp. MSK16QG-6]MCP1198269.1 AtpZ/AtpI family protein [Notoacmeibacter sp. MSK16QG-6]
MSDPQETAGKAGLPDRQKLKTGEGALDDRLARLNEKLDAKTVRDTADGDNIRGKSGMGQALRLSSEFVAAILVGAGLGWAFDYAFGTGPFGMIGFLMLGFAAGILNIMRATGRVSDFGAPVQGEHVKSDFTVGSDDEGKSA